MCASTPGSTPTREAADRPGMCASTPGSTPTPQACSRVREAADRRGIRASTAGTCRVTEPADRRGMRASTPSLGRMREPADRRGMIPDALFLASGRHVLGLPAQRVGIQLPRALGIPLKNHDLAREAVSCNAGLDGRLRDALSSRLILLERHGLRMSLQPCHEIVCRIHRCGRGRVN